MQHRVFLIIVLPEQKGFLTLWCPLPMLHGMAIGKLNSKGQSCSQRMDNGLLVVLKS